jgi:hypothetical protein|tara:strand:- start:704 stop:829 length:126 start_codon:yes stop_codon:yes gene_type:complete
MKDFQHAQLFFSPLGDVLFDFRTTDFSRPFEAADAPFVSLP